MQVMDIFGPAGNRLGFIMGEDLIDWSINHELNAYNVSSFTIPVSAPGASFLAAGNRVRTFERGTTVYEDEYIIVNVKTQRSKDNKKILEVEMELNAIELIDGFPRDLEILAKSQKDALDLILEDSNWYSGVCQSTKFRSLDSVYDLNWLESVQKVREIWGGVLVYDSLNRVIHMLDDIGDDAGVSFEYEKNIETINREEDIKELATVIYPFGDTDLMIHAATPVGMEPAPIYGYVENYSWYTGIDPITGEQIPGYGQIDPYTGEFYTIEEARQRFKKIRKWTAGDHVEVQKLYMDSIDYLKTICKPKISYSLDLIDLSDLTGQDSFNLGDKVTVKDLELGINVKVQIVKYEEHRLDRSKSRVELSNTVENLADVLQQSVRSSLLVNDQISRLKALGRENKLHKFLKGVLKLYEDIVNGGVSLIEAEDSEGNKVKLSTRGLLLQEAGEPEKTAVTGKGIYANMLVANEAHILEIVSNYVKIVGGENGLSLDPNDGLIITREDDELRIIANATGGFRIQQKVGDDWDDAKDLLYADSEGNLRITGFIKIGEGDEVFKADLNGIYLGDESFTLAPFWVSPDGELTATNANIKGTVEATDFLLDGVSILTEQGKKIDGQYVSGAVGMVQNLIVDTLSTSDKIKNYLDGDTSQIRYIRVYDQFIEFVEATYSAGSEQATSTGLPGGPPLYWVDENHQYVTVEVTEYPVMVYSYNELVKGRYGFKNVDGVNVPMLELGAGDLNGNSIGRIYKGPTGLYFEYKATNGTTRVFAITDSGIDLSQFENVTFSSTVQIGGLSGVWVQPDPPANAQERDLWVDTDDFSRYDKLELSVSTTLLISDPEVILVSGSPTITLHTATNPGIIKKVYNVGNGLVTLAGTINGETDMFLYPGEALELVTDGSGWRC